MAQITIQRGQTLSGLAKKHGTTVQDLMRLNPQIKNPNLIITGANLSLPELAPPAPAPPAPAAPTASSLAAAPAPAANVPAKNTLYGQEVPSNLSLLKQYRSELGLDTTLQNLQTGQRQYLDTLQNLPKKSDIYQQERTKRGVDTIQKNLQSLDDRLATMEEAINTSEQDIRNRIIQGGGIVTESQTQRLAASEKQPLINEYRKLLGERNKLAQRLGTEETAAKEMAGMQYEDQTRPLSVAEKTLGFQKEQYDVLGNILNQVFGASEKDVTNIINAAKYGKEADRKEAQDVIDRAIKLAELANKTPAGTTLNIGGTKITGLKGAGEGETESDIESYALELLNNPNFLLNNVPQKIRAQVIKKRDQIKAEAEAQAQQAIAQQPEQPPVNAEQVGESIGTGVRKFTTETIPNFGKGLYRGLRGYFRGLQGPIAGK